MGSCLATFVKSNISVAASLALCKCFRFLQNLWVLRSPSPLDFTHFTGGVNIFCGATHYTPGLTENRLDLVIIRWKVQYATHRINHFTIECVHGGQYGTTLFLWAINFIFMLIFFIVLLLQHGLCKHTLLRFHHQPSNSFIH